MRVVIALCSAVYTGRGDTKLVPAKRAIMIKADGAVSIHSDKGNKPLNYMSATGMSFSQVKNLDGSELWSFDNRKESLQISMYDIYSDSLLPLSEYEPGLVRDGTESHLQEYLFAHPEIVGEGFTTVSREYPTGEGPVDILLLDQKGNKVAVEVKRTAMLSSADQISRYVQALESTYPDEEISGVIAALDIRPKTRLLAEKRGIRCVIVPPDWNNVGFEENVQEIEI